MKVVFLHIPKTGGTSLHNLLTKHYSTTDCCPERYNELKRYSKEELNMYRFFSGHYNWDQISLIPGEKQVITLLREPRQRILSLYYYWRSLTWRHINNNHLIGPKLAKSLSLLDFLEKEEPIIQYEVNNIVTKRFIGDSFLNKNRGSLKNDNELYKAALENIDKLSEIGILEYMPYSVKKIFQKLGFDTPKQLKHDRNSATIKTSQVHEIIEKEPLNNEIIAKLSELTKIDRKIYQYVLDKNYSPLSIGKRYVFSSSFPGNEKWISTGYVELCKLGVKINSNVSCLRLRFSTDNSRLSYRIRIMGSLCSTNIDPLCLLVYLNGACVGNWFLEENNENHVFDTFFSSQDLDEYKTLKIKFKNQKKITTSNEKKPDSFLLHFIETD